MRCPFCAAAETKVIDSRLANEGDAVRRRRECLTCSERFTTFETAELLLPRVVKRDGSRVPFEEQRLRSGMLRALEKRPVATERVEAAIHGIMRQVRSCGDRELSSQTLGDWVMEALRKLDQVAYVRFASVYRSFEDVHAFREEIDRLERHPSSEIRIEPIKRPPGDETADS